MAPRNSKKKGAKHATSRRRVEAEAQSIVATAVEAQPVEDGEQGGAAEESSSLEHCVGEQNSQDTEDSSVETEPEEKQEIADAQRRYSTEERNKFSNSLISQSNSFVREKLFRIIKFADDVQLYKFKAEIRSTLLTGLHADDRDSRVIFDTMVFPEIVRSYKVNIRHRRRSVNQAMEKIAVGKHKWHLSDLAKRILGPNTFLFQLLSWMAGLRP
jgi:hypothetical protein